MKLYTAILNRRASRKTRTSSVGVNTTPRPSTKPYLLISLMMIFGGMYLLASCGNSNADEIRLVFDNMPVKVACSDTPSFIEDHSAIAWPVCPKNEPGPLGIAAIIDDNDIDLDWAIVVPYDQEANESVDWILFDNAVDIDGTKTHAVQVKIFDDGVCQAKSTFFFLFNQEENTFRPGFKQRVNGLDDCL